MLELSKVYLCVQTCNDIAYLLRGKIVSYKIKVLQSNVITETIIDTPNDEPANEN